MCIQSHPQNAIDEEDLAFPSHKSSSSSFLIVFWSPFKLAMINQEISTKIIFFSTLDHLTYDARERNLFNQYRVTGVFPN